MTIFRSPILVLDVESTGLLSDPLARPIDLGAVVLDVDGTEIASFSTLIRPTTWGDGAEKSAKIHGITFDMVKDAPKPAEVCADFRTWREVHGVTWATAFNVAFDRPMTERMGISLRWAPCIMLRAMDLMGLAGALRPADPGHPRYEEGRPWLFPPLSPRPEADRRGQSACEFFGVEPVTPAHRALSDATTAARVLVEVVRRAR